MLSDSLKQLIPKMEYRRFGRTEESVSVITLGGMRYKLGWNPPRAHLPSLSFENCMETTCLALELGINHIETAHGYMKSEHLYGKVLKELKIPRVRYKMMTKGAPMTSDETRRLVEEQLNALQLDYVDFYGWHGINNEERFRAATQTGGPVETLLRLKEEGVIRHIGFSTHAPLDIILKSIETDLFSFVNLHYYYFFQRNFPAVELAGKKDIGVFIISPNEKGGMLWKPTHRVEEACKPLSAIQFNGRFCLGHPQITTLSMGMHEPEHFLQNLSLLSEENYGGNQQAEIKKRLDTPLIGFVDRCTFCSECLPCPENINIPEVLRFQNLLECYQMEDYGKFRYNMLEENGHWFPGSFAFRCTECGDCLPRCPEKLNIPKLLFKTHRQLFNRWEFLKVKVLELAKRLFKILFSQTPAS